ncbi:MAG TPA: hypothetical protein VKB78_04445, partial [Pirellulales bacterium]|nr:hypothetical protein [Pirellulales bacterium]
EKAIESIKTFARRVCPDKINEEGAALRETASPESLGRWEAIAAGTLTLAADQQADMPILRLTLLDFIADFANWDNSIAPAYLETARALTQAAHEALGGAPGTRPLVVDPFAGGGSIPLEALRVGADAFASDLNPVAVLLNKVVLEYVPRFGKRLADAVKKWGEWIKQEAERELAQFYPKDPDGRTPIAYLWARTINCEGPGCGAEVPLLRSLLLAKRGVTSTFFELITDKKSKKVEFRIREGKANETEGTIRKGSATCPLCGFTTPNSRVRAQLTERFGGAASARLIGVVTIKGSELGRSYRTATDADITAAIAAANELSRRADLNPDPIALVPNEEIPTARPSPNARGLSAVTRMGVSTFGQLFTPRQALTLSTFARLISQVGQQVDFDVSGEFRDAVQTVLAFGLDRLVDRSSTLCRWDPTPTASGIINTFSRQALPILWDFAEGTPF